MSGSLTLLTAVLLIPLYNSRGLFAFSIPRNLFLSPQLLLYFFLFSVAFSSWFKGKGEGWDIWVHNIWRANRANTL